MNTSRDREIKKPIKVLYINDCLNSRSGVSSVMMNYFRFIDQREVIIDFMCWKEESDENIIKEINTTKSKYYEMPRLTYNNFFEIKKFFNIFFSQHHYDIVHSHFCEMDEIVFPIARKYGVKKCISHSHNIKFSEYKLRAIRNQLMCLNIGKVADIWAACSTVAGVSLYGRKFRTSENSLFIHNAIDTEKFKFNSEVRKRVRTELGIDDDIIVLGNVGSLKPQKNQAFLFDVMKGLKNQHKSNKYLLLLAGDGDLHQDLVEKAKYYGVSEDVRFLGLRRDVPELLQAMDIFVLPSLYEGLPVGGIEAQAAGLPCLFSNTITREVDIVRENCYYLPLKQDEWVEKISNMKKVSRLDNTRKIIQAGYDIQTESENITVIYQRLVE